MNYLEELFVYTLIILVVIVGVIVGLNSTEAGHTGEENENDSSDKF